MTLFLHFTFNYCIYQGYLSILLYIEQPLSKLCIEI